MNRVAKKKRKKKKRRKARFEFCQLPTSLLDDPFEDRGGQGKGGEKEERSGLTLVLLPFNPHFGKKIGEAIYNGRNEEKGKEEGKK